MKQLKRVQLNLAETDRCAYWAEPISFVVQASRSVREWASLVKSAGQSILIIDEKEKPIGTLSARGILRLIEKLDTCERELQQDLLDPVQYAEGQTSIDGIQFNGAALVLVKEGETIIGGITKERYHQAKGHFLKDDHQQEIILKTIIETAYEGIVIVDQDGKIVSMNKAYLSFLGREEEYEVVGKFVADVIENTELHHVVKSGIPQRGRIQVIQGQKMVVHRMPIWQKQQVVGAIGMLIFEGVSELYKILKSANDSSIYDKKSVEVKNTQMKLYSFEQMIGKSSALHMCKSFARKASRTTAAVLITGESGTGKELFARSIHQLSSQAEGAFVAINCAAVPETLLEAELFGYEEGSFTGAKKGGSIGKFEQADRGTLFLDEIGDMSLSMQAKLLRVLEVKEITRIGGNEERYVHFRLIAATNKKLKELVSSGHFREDLYYRINVIPLYIPSLRERIEDLPLLMSHYIEEFAREYQLEAREFGAEALQAMLSYHWPGNIRELVNVINYIMTISENRIVSLLDLPGDILARKDRVQKMPLKSTAREKEKKVIKEVLIEAKGNKSVAAKILGVHRSTLYRKLKNLDLDIEPL
ncbi:sigma 54-interacting transcriptional regulator [Bacillus sp. JCM 19041]|uniref:sigma-54 interaction domain-containing protein n=1 Tax=Bacillus sp. JCM 19041 TaxID=1460637 RepID=UPI0006D27604